MDVLVQISENIIRFDTCLQFKWKQGQVLIIHHMDPKNCCGLDMGSNNPSRDFMALKQQKAKDEIESDKQNMILFAFPPIVLRSANLNLIRLKHEVIQGPPQKNEKSNIKSRPI